MHSPLLHTARVWGVEKGQEVTLWEEKEEGRAKDRRVQEGSALALVVM